MIAFAKNSSIKGKRLSIAQSIQNTPTIRKVVSTISFIVCKQSLSLYVNIYIKLFA